VCRYVEARSSFDFAAQRQRADAGYAQLRRLGILRSGDCPSLVAYLAAVLRETLADPVGGVSWAALQVRARFLDAYRVSGGNRGAWETQTTTKRSID
jgi:hypothetical protein